MIWYRVKKKLMKINQNLGVVPVGLDELDRTDRIIVQQMSGMTDGCCNCYEGENQYDISDRFDHVIMQAVEQSNCCSRQCCHRLRSFNMELKDRRGEAVAIMERPFRCDNCVLCPGNNQVKKIVHKRMKFNRDLCLPIHTWSCSAIDA